MISSAVFFGFILALFYTVSIVQCDREVKLYSVEGNVTDPKFSLTIEYKKYNSSVYILSGELDLIEPMTDLTFIAVLIYVNTGEDTYEKTPFGTPPQKLSDFMNGFHKNIVQDQLKSCSNLHYIEENETWMSPYPSGKYSLTDCIINIEKVSDFMDPGNYKCLLVVMDDQTYAVEAILRITAS